MASVDHGPVDEREFGEFLTSLSSGFVTSVKDQMIKIKALVKNHSVTCAQVAAACENTKQCWCDTAVVMYPAISDKDQFEAVVMPVFKFDDEREEVRQKLAALK